MNKYLLLRDNKQSGPHTTQQLETLGLKPYDLVWQEGRSAAWRYPSEIDDLKSFAPIVEEQPFDRFYKKSPRTTEVPVKDHTEVVIQTPRPQPARDMIAPSEKKNKPYTASKIFVTLPSTPVAKSLQVNESKEGIDDSVKQPDQQKDHAKYSLYANGGNEGFKETLPSTFGQRVSEKDTINDTRTSKSSLYRSQNLWVRSLIAASLLLVGVVIGMYFMNRSQQKNLQELNSLVQQIQEKNRKQTMPVANPDFTSQEQQQATVSLAPVGGFLTVEEETASKTTTSTPAKITAQKKPVSSVQKDETSTPLLEDDTVERVTPITAPPVKNEIPKELAKKNLFQLVNVKGNKYKTGLLGGISNLQLTVTNKSLYQLEKVDVVIEYLGPENKVVRTQTVAFENVAPGEELTIDVPKSSRGVSVRQAIKQINSRELGIAHAGK